MNVHQSMNCPVGRQPLRSADLRHIIAFDRVVETLEVFCPHRESGCTWTGSLDNTNNHRQQCLEEHIPCTHTGCGQMVKRGNMVVHSDTCDMKPEECPHCRTVLPVRQQSNHQRYACKKAPIICPFSCSDGEIPR